jgi:aspartyl protease family protein
MVYGRERPVNRRSVTSQLVFVSGTLLWLLMLNSSVMAVEKIEVIALFTGKVIVKIDGQRRVIAEGDITEEGVEGVRINSERAILRVDGVERAYTLNTRIGGPYAQQEKKRVDIYRSSNGHYIKAGSINGIPVKFMIDTGASEVAISAREAKRIGIDYQRVGRPIQVNTASSVWPAYSVTFDRVTLGAIELRFIKGVVVEGDKPDTPLLGMSFLSKMKVSKEGAVMHLEY